MQTEVQNTVTVYIVLVFLCSVLALDLKLSNSSVSILVIFRNGLQVLVTSSVLVDSLFLALLKYTLDMNHELINSSSFRNGLFTLALRQYSTL